MITDGHQRENGEFLDFRDLLIISSHLLDRALGDGTTISLIEKKTYLSTLDYI